MIKLEIGQQVYLKPINSLARRHSGIYTATIEKVGRKFAKIKDNYDLYANTEFDIQNMCEKSVYSPNYKVYLTYEDADNSTKEPREREITISMVKELNYKDLIRVQKFITDILNEK